MIRYTMLMTCDGCGAEIAKAEPGITEIPPTRWKMNEHLQKTGGIVRTRWHGKTLHYCGKCSDGPVPKKTRKTDPKEGE